MVASALLPDFPFEVTMRLPSTPATIFATLCALFVPTGAGLTAPIWLMVMGVPLNKAAEVGSRIVGVTVLACGALAAAYFLILRPRIESNQPSGPALAAEQEPHRHNPRQQRLVHAIVWTLFVLPFVLIIVGFIVGQLDKLSID
jgi:hypothetical protein